MHSRGAQAQRPSPPSFVARPSPSDSSAKPRSFSLLDVESQASMALFDLANTFLVNPPSPAHLLSTTPISEFPVVEGQVRGAN